MSEQLESLLSSVKLYVTEYFTKNMPEIYAFHNLEHTLEVLQAAELLANKEEISKSDTLLLQIAAWFHDTGYTEGGFEHEIRSVALAKEFLDGKLTTEQLDIVEGIILATRMPQMPKTQLQKIICDADLSHLGNEHFWQRNDLLKEEMANVGNKMGRTEWLKFEIGFISTHKYFTQSAQTFYEGNKQMFLKQLQYDLSKRKKKSKKSPKEDDSPESDFNIKNLSRSTETMLKTAYSTHLNLNSLADGKAHTMLNINSIIFSAVSSFLIPKWGADSRLIIPSIVLLSSSLLAVFFAILTIKPKLIKGSISKQEVLDKKADLLFFSNYVGMKLSDYQWAMRQMIQDPAYTYNSMSRSLYFLGVVLNKKYRFLTYCYMTFLYGLLLAVILFAVCMLILPKT